MSCPYRESIDLPFLVRKLNEVQPRLNLALRSFGPTNDVGLQDDKLFRPGHGKNRAGVPKEFIAKKIFIRMAASA
jgi:hypothetical protein